MPSTMTQSDILEVSVAPCPEVEEMIAQGSKRGHISYDELNNTLPDEMVDTLIRSFS